MSVHCCRAHSPSCYAFECMPAWSCFLRALPSLPRPGARGGGGAAPSPCCGSGAHPRPGPRGGGGGGLKEKRKRRPSLVGWRLPARGEGGAGWGAPPVMAGTSGKGQSAAPAAGWAPHNANMPGARWAGGLWASGIVSSFPWQGAPMHRVPPTRQQPGLWGLGVPGDHIGLQVCVEGQSPPRGRAAVEHRRPRLHRGRNTAAGLAE